MRWFRDLRAEIKARRAGRKFTPNGIRRSARDITGPHGWVLSDTWRELDSRGDAYLDSFDRRIPPSLHISERDRHRYNMPIPMAERCVEDWRADPDDAPAGEPGSAEVDTTG